MFGGCSELQCIYFCSLSCQLKRESLRYVKPACEHMISIDPALNESMEGDAVCVCGGGGGGGRGGGGGCCCLHCVMGLQ